MNAEEVRKVLQSCKHYELVEFRLKEYAESRNAIGTVYIVEEVHGRCGCADHIAARTIATQTAETASYEMTAEVGYFRSRHHAMLFVITLTALQKDVIGLAKVFLPRAPLGKSS